MYFIIQEISGDVYTENGHPFLSPYDMKEKTCCCMFTFLFFVKKTCLIGKLPKFHPGFSWDLTKYGEICQTFYIEKSWIMFYTHFNSYMSDFYERPKFFLPFSAYFYCCIMVLNLYFSLMISFPSPFSGSQISDCSE